MAELMKCTKHAEHMSRSSNSVREKTREAEGDRESKLDRDGAMAHGARSG